MLLNVVIPLLISIVVFILIINMFKSDMNFLEARFERLNQKKYRFSHNQNIAQDTFLNRVGKPVLEKISGFFKAINVKLVSVDNLENKLVWAGEPYSLSTEQFLGIKILLGITFPVFTIIYFIGLTNFETSSFFLVILSLGLGYYLPDLLLNSTIKKRKLEIRKELPSVLDVMSVSSDAGLDFNSTIKKMVEKQDGILPEEFKTVLYEMEVGENRRKALRNLAQRCNVDEVTRFVNAVNQSEEYGTSITQVLKSQAVFVRQTLKNQSEEKVQKAQTKLIVPLVFFSLPAIFIVILGPAVLQFLM